MVSSAVPVAVPSADGQRTCARGDFCTAPRFTPVDGGGTRREPALTWQGFCPADEAAISRDLQELPEGWARMAASLGDPAVVGAAIRVPFGPAVPLSEYYDALMRTVAVRLCAWEARTRAAAQLSARPSAETGTLDAVTTAAGTLESHLSVLLALPPGWMTRTLPLAPGRHGMEAAISPEFEDTWGDSEVVRVGVDSVTLIVSLDGTCAGLDVLGLHRDCQRALGEVAARPEILDGIPCRSCEAMGLERAAPPSDPQRPAMHSRCPVCHEEMDLRTYRDWVTWYAAWARGIAEVTCQRCLNGGHGECIYRGCACAGAGHLAG